MEEGYQKGPLLPRFLLTSEQLGLMTFLVKASLERLLSQRDKLKPQNKNNDPTANVWFWFEVKTMVLNAWFSHSFIEKIHSVPLPFDCWQTELSILSLVSPPGRVQDIQPPTSKARSEVSCRLNIPPASWAENPSSGGTKHQPSWEEVDMLVTSSLSETYWDFWGQCERFYTSPSQLYKGSTLVGELLLLECC